MSLIGGYQHRSHKQELHKKKMVYQRFADVGPKKVFYKLDKSTIIIYYNQMI